MDRRVVLKPIPGTVPNLIYPPPGCRFHPRCPEKMDICSKEKPKMIEVKDGHYVACHLYNGKR
jgi:peptide/nickel transport system ATP-binding protein